jgi:tRNA (cytidine56-2'-O)-methyltransferase
MPARRNDRRPEVSVLRIGHRPGRDPRLTTHLALTARAFGADRLFLHPPDPELADRIHGIGVRWGGSFRVIGSDNWKSTVREFEGLKVHLTMYGRPMASALPRLRRASHVLLIVGGPKVPADLFLRSDLNVAVGHQPHSEVAAVAAIMAAILGVPGPAPWPGAQHIIVPRARGKKVVTRARAGAG